jgi:cobalamin biosynthesis Mg chelatase CobN
MITTSSRAGLLHHRDAARRGTSQLSCRPFAPEAPHPRTLREEIGRVVRGRASNPKWIAGVMRHGYKGAFEMAATLDYLFAFAATTAGGQRPSFRCAVRGLHRR